MCTGAVDYNSLKLIENAIGTAAKFKKPIRHWSEAELKKIDLGLLEAGIEGLRNGLYQLVCY